MDVTNSSLDRIADIAKFAEHIQALETCGFAIVPRQPTEAMLRVGSADVYRAMLDAAPKFVAEVGIG